jgi:hypothetical protein
MQYRLGVARRYASATLFAVSAISLTACTNIIDLDPRQLGERAPRSDDEGDPSTGGAGLGAGLGDGGTDPELSARSLSNEAIWSLVSDFKYRGDGFRRVDRAPFPSTVSPDKKIAIYISEQAYAEYTRISPDQTGSGASLPVGSVIVREVLRETALDSITVMVRLPEGAFPLGGDWWFAAATADGTLKTDASIGAPVIGLSATCGSCHLRRDQDDFLFGVPAASLD